MSNNISASLLRVLPRLGLNNIRNTGKPPRPKRGRAQHGGDKHGAGNKGSGQRQNYMRLGYETGNNPFYQRFPYEAYNRGHHLRKQYPPLSLLQLQTFIDTNRIDISRPIDLASLCNTGLYNFQPDERCYGVNLTDEGVDNFKSKIHIEVQRASELVIASIERNGGTIRTAYYDIDSLWLLKDPMKFFKRGQPIPRRMLPTEDLVMYYSDAKNRGYLANPKEIAEHQVLLSQKYGYDLTLLKSNDVTIFKDPRQIFYGLQPGWIINYVDKEILKPQNEMLQRFYEIE